MERLTKETGGTVQVRSHNWKSLLLSCLIMASKVWDDLSMWNADFSQVSPSFTLKRINELELALLDFLRYSVKVTASDYAKYYFHLRSYCVRLGLSSDLRKLAPLNLDGAKKLSVLSAQYEESAQASATMKRRCASMPEVKEVGGGGVALRGGGGGGWAPKGASLEQVTSKMHLEAGQTNEEGNARR